jgi:hypothetical protein
MQAGGAKPCCATSLRNKGKSLTVSRETCIVVVAQESTVDAVRFAIPENSGPGPGSKSGTVRKRFFCALTNGGTLPC